MKTIIITAVLLIVSTAAQASHGHSGGGTGSGTCAPSFNTANIGGLIGAGTIDYCIYVPTIVHGSTGNDDTARITAVVSGPSGTTVSFVYTTNVVNGCAFSTITQVDTVGTFGSMSSAHWNLDLVDGANQCTGLVRVRVNAGITPTAVYEAFLPFMIQTEPVEQDNLNRWCASSAWNTTCTQPTVIIQDDDSGWIVHQDEACGATIPCLSNQTLQFGNISADQNNTVFGDTQKAVRDWVPLIIAFAVLALATMRAKPNYLAVIVAGAFFAYAAIYCPFNEITIRIMVALFGIYNALLGSLEMYGQKPGNTNMEA